MDRDDLDWVVVSKFVTIQELCAELQERARAHESMARRLAQCKSDLGKFIDECVRVQESERAMKHELLRRCEAHEGAIMDAAEWHARAVIAERVVAEECGRELERMWAGCLAHILEMQDRCEATDAVVEAARAVEYDWQENPHMQVSAATMSKLIDALRAMEPGGDE